MTVRFANPANELQPDPPGPYVIHAPARDGEAALCEAAALPSSILGSGPMSAIDCPDCIARLATPAGLADASEGARAAQDRLYGASP